MSRSTTWELLVFESTLKTLEKPQWTPFMLSCLRCIPLHCPLTEHLQNCIPYCIFATQCNSTPPLLETLLAYTSILGAETGIQIFTDLTLLHLNQEIFLTNNPGSTTCRRLVLLGFSLNWSFKLKLHSYMVRSLEEAHKDIPFHWWISSKPTKLNYFLIYGKFMSIKLNKFVIVSRLTLIYSYTNNSLWCFKLTAALILWRYHYMYIRL